MPQVHRFASYLQRNKQKVQLKCIASVEVTIFTKMTSASDSQAKQTYGQITWKWGTPGW